MEITDMEREVKFTKTCEIKGRTQGLVTTYNFFTSQYIYNLFEFKERDAVLYSLRSF